MERDDIQAPVAPLQLIVVEAAGYCDPVTGMCVTPDASESSDEGLQPLSPQGVPTPE